jgi:hypothetical protein
MALRISEQPMAIVCSAWSCISDGFTSITVGRG